MQQVEIVQLSGDALNWVKFGIIAQLAIGAVVLVLLTAITVRTLWGRS